MQLKLAIDTDKSTGVFYSQIEHFISSFILSYYINPSIKNHPTFLFEHKVDLWFTHWMVISSYKGHNLSLIFMGHSLTTKLIGWVRDSNRERISSMKLF